MATPPLGASCWYISSPGITFHSFSPGGRRSPVPGAASSDGRLIPVVEGATSASSDVSGYAGFITRVTVVLDVAMDGLARCGRRSRSGGCRPGTTRGCCGGSARRPGRPSGRGRSPTSGRTGSPARGRAGPGGEAGGEGALDLLPVDGRALGDRSGGPADAVCPASRSATGVAHKTGDQVFLPAWRAPRHFVSVNKKAWRRSER